VLRYKRSNLKTLCLCDNAFDFITLNSATTSSQLEVSPEIKDSDSGGFSDESSGNLLPL